MPSLRIVSRLNKATPLQPWSLKEYFDRRNDILIVRGTGGLGDVLMHRMIFEDFHLLNPNCRITFACPPAFMGAIEGHPFVHEVVNCESVDHSRFLARYDTTTICGRIEMQHAPYSAPHRSDIWADHCGIQLTKHNMHLTVGEKEKEWAGNMVNGAKVCFCPLSAISSKNLDDEQIRGVTDGLRERGLSFYAVHGYKFPGFDGPCYSGSNPKQIIALVGAADYVITVDSAAFHIGGGLKKPMVGVFSWADGKVYGKYYENWKLVQRHRDSGWDCGPCYNWSNCVKCPGAKLRKPCITEITAHEILEAFDEVRTK